MARSQDKAKRGGAIFALPSLLTPEMDRGHASIMERRPFCISCMGGMKMQAAVKYNSEIKTVPFGGRTIKFESLTPILPPKERERRKRDIEKRLYDVFIKYEKR